MNTEPQTETQKKETLLEQLSKNELLSLIKQMIQIYPDLAQLVDYTLSATPSHSKPQPAPFDPELYRLKVEQIFLTTDRDTWGSEGRAAEPLLDIMQIADEAVAQQDYANATMLYEIILRGILENYETFRWHADEGDLDTVVQDGIDELNTCLQKELQDRAIRTRVIQLLCDIYDFDNGLMNDKPVMSATIPTILVRHTTSDERKSVAKWVRTRFELALDWNTDDISDDYDPLRDLLLGLEADGIDDETFLRICRETENAPYLIERLLKRGRHEEALAEAQQVDNYAILEIADILCEQGQEAAALHLIEERSAQSDNAALLEWLQTQYQSRGNDKGVLDMACRLFCTSTFGDTIEQYRTIHQLAEPLGRWETVQSELLAHIHQSHNIKIQIQIALDDGLVKEALELLEAQRQTENPHQGPYSSDTFDVGLVVAHAAEESFPQEAIAIYQHYAQTRIGWRGRDNYRMACQYLTNIRRLFQQMGKSDEWTTSITALREQHRTLPALKDEMAKARLALS